MIYPIVAYGDPVLRKEGKHLQKEELDLPQLIEDMFETMYNAGGVGLAAPQIGKSIRVFIMDSSPLEESEEKGVKRVFVNPEIIEESEEDWNFEEGCLSIPGIRDQVKRPADIRIHYYDEKWNEHEEDFYDVPARIIQHEYDHLEGILFTDQYQLTMAQLYYHQGIHEQTAQFDHFYRDNPHYGDHQAGYAIHAGLEWLINWMQDARFGKAEIDALCAGKLVNAIKNGEAWAICFYAKCRMGWSEKHQHTGDPENPVRMVIETGVPRSDDEPE